METIYQRRFFALIAGVMQNPYPGILVVSLTISVKL